MDFKQYKRLLVLADAQSKGLMSILQWTPFRGGDTLDEIVQQHNEWIYDRCKKMAVLEEDIPFLGEGIDPMPNDIVNADELRDVDYVSIKILVLDPGVAKPHGDKLNRVKERISRAFVLEREQSGKVHFWHLGMLNSKQTDMSDIPWLKSGPFVRVPLSSQKKFETWLRHFSEHFIVALFELESMPSFGDSKVMLSLLKQYPTVAAEVRDAAMMQKLSLDDTRGLARQAFWQERVLTKIAKDIGSGLEFQINTEPVRTPLLKMQVTPDFKRLRNTRLLALELTKPLSECTKEQRIMLKNLGIKGKNIQAVHADRALLQKTVAPFSHIIKATTFSAKLPQFDTGVVKGFQFGSTARGMRDGGMRDIHK